MRKRIAAIILALSMAITILPMSALAADEPGEEPEAGPSVSAEDEPGKTPLGEGDVAGQQELEEVYLSGTHGNDENSGDTEENAVQTFEKAKSLLAKDGTIYLCGQVTISGKETWSLADYGDAKIQRYNIKGHMIELGEGADLTLEDIVIDGAYTPGEPDFVGDSIIHSSAPSTLVLEDGCVLQNNEASHMGSAISGWDKLSLTMEEGAVIQNNKTFGEHYGGGIFLANGCTFTMNGGEIKNNESDRGGGVAVIASDMIMYGGTISGNSTYVSTYGPDGYGGGIYLADYEDISGLAGVEEIQPAETSFTMNGGSITNNTVQDYGGAILAYPQGNRVSGENQKDITITIHGGTISDNKVTSGSGGAIALFYNESKLVMDGGEISNNTASNGSGYGGGIFLHSIADPDSVSISGGAISGNKAWRGGGLALFAGSKATISGGTISGNSALSAGGVENAGTFNMTGGEITGNQATGNDAANGLGIGGGVVNVDGGTFTMTGGKIYGNTAGTGANDFYNYSEAASGGVDVGVDDNWDGNHDMVLESLDMGAATYADPVTSTFTLLEASQFGYDNWYTDKPGARYSSSNKTSVYTVKSDDTSEQYLTLGEPAEQEQLWYFEVYYEYIDPYTNQAEWIKWKHGQGGWAKPSATVSISHERFDGEDLGWEDITGKQNEKLGTHYVYDENYGPHRLSALCKDATSDNPLKIYYRAALNDVVYKYEGEVPEGADKVLPAAEKKPYYSSVTVAAAPTLPGYTFSGWKVQSPAYTEIENDTFTMPNETVTLVGSWQKDPNATFTVTYQYENPVPENAPELPGQASYTEGAEVTVADAPTLDGYTFSGWTVKEPASGVTIADGKFTMPGSDVVLTGSWTEIPEPLETITLTPQSMTAYTGGDSISEDEFPSVRYAIDGADPEDLTFFVDNTPCEPEPAGTYWLLSGIDNTFTAKARAAAEDDREAGVYDIGVAPQTITAQDTDGTEYEVTVADAGELTVRYVSAPEDVIDDVDAVATEIVHDEAAVDTSHGMAVAVIPAGADFYTNGKTSGLGLVGTAKEDPQISLLFDDILECDYAGGDSTVDMMVDRAADAGYPLREGRYQFKYLDLVNEHDGNAWVSADEDITIFWPYPDGTNARDYDFYVLHFQGLHREYEIDSLEEMEELIGASDIELIAAEATSGGIRFTLDGDAEAGSFSPFALVWEKAADDRPTRPQRPSRPDPEPEEPEEPAPQEGPTGLNTTDHYAYIAGYEDGTVRPEGNITRAEVATIFFRLMTDEYRETYWATSNLFTDVAPGSWYNNAISTTARAGWIGGYPDGSYRPNNFITRAEFAAIASRFLSDAYSGGDLFTDIGGHWAADHINRASRAGWIGGYPDGSFHPDAYITRAEAVTLINRMLDRAPDAGHLLADMVRWPDNPETAWYYADIQEATNSHDYTRAGTGDFEVWTELLPNRDWAALEAAWAQAADAPGGAVADNLTPNVPGDDN